MDYFAVVLLAVNTALLLVMVFILVVVRWQGRRIARLAEESRDLAQKADEHQGEQIHIEDLDDEDRQRLLAEMRKLAEASGHVPGDADEASDASEETA